MDDQIVMIDLVEDEAAGEKTESYQDKIVKLKARWHKWTDLKNSSNEEGYSLFRTAAPPTYKCNAHFDVQHKSE
ncbi:hypothetical protein A4A49_53818 [Nicotiana attenuata]|uniref:Uncharacterized protein n=1 Tax=Nicotiana attenuata TaxID=49451 RepID=A0A1J6KB79_NICAT|nr:hypothetical protein A4A49_53818 [Nicotiana attenuata]